MLCLAELFVYPSPYEGFGLPVIAANSSSLPEVVGDAEILVDPRSSVALEEAMSLVLGSPQRQANLRRRALDRATKFSWEHTATLTAEIYERVLAEAGSAS
jgi:glycosyltransferase involved in cell wall biosynthesis